MDCVQHRRPHYWNHWNSGAAVATAGGSFRLHLRVARWILRWSGIDSRRFDCGLLVCTEEASGVGGSVPNQRRLHLQRRLELARGGRNADRLCACLDRTCIAPAAIAVRLCLVRWLRRRCDCLHRSDETRTTSSDVRDVLICRRLTRHSTQWHAVNSPSFTAEGGRGGGTLITH